MKGLQRNPISYRIVTRHYILPPESQSLFIASDHIYKGKHYKPEKLDFKLNNPKEVMDLTYDS